MSSSFGRPPLDLPLTIRERSGNRVVHGSCGSVATLRGCPAILPGGVPPFTPRSSPEGLGDSRRRRPCGESALRSCRRRIMADIMRRGRFCHGLCERKRHRPRQPELPPPVNIKALCCAAAGTPAGGLDPPPLGKHLPPQTPHGGGSPLSLRVLDAALRRQSPMRQGEISSSAQRTPGD